MFKNEQMKKNNISMFFALLLSAICWGQNNMGKTDDINRIAIAPVIIESALEMPKGLDQYMMTKMRQMISLNGLSAINDAPLFIIFPEIAVVDEQVTTTIPAMYIKEIEVNLVVADQYTKTAFSTVSYNLKGAGKTEKKAYQQALKRINPRDPRIKAFISKGKEAIIKYYNSDCDLIITRANSLLEQGQKEEALKLLNSVPPVCRECYDKANDLAASIATGSAEIDSTKIAD